MAYIIQIRRDTAANFTAANPILAQGEPAMETDTLKEKIGNGVDAWSALPYRDYSFLLIIDGFFAKKGVGNTGAGFEIGDFGHGWEGNTFLAFKVTGLPYTAPGNRINAIDGTAL